MLTWANEHREVLYMVAISMGVGALAFIGGMIAVVCMPPDAFEHDHKPRTPAMRIVRAVVGWVLVVAGIAMLMLPGPGLVVLLLGVMLAEFPGRDRVKRWILSRDKVLGPINKLRERFGREPVRVKPA